MAGVVTTRTLRQGHIVFNPKSKEYRVDTQIKQQQMTLNTEQSETLGLNNKKN